MQLCGRNMDTMGDDGLKLRRWMSLGRLFRGVHRGAPHNTEGTEISSNIEIRKQDSVMVRERERTKAILALGSHGIKISVCGCNTGSRIASDISTSANVIHAR